MKKSIGDNMIPPGWSFEQGLELIKKARFDGVDLWIGEVPWFRMETPDAAVLQLRHAVESAGLVVSNVSNSLHWKFPFSSPDAKTREYAIRITEREIETAVLLGCEAILVVPGLVERKILYTDAYKRTVECLQRLAPVAAKAKIKIGCEPNTCYQRFLLSPQEFLGFLGDVGSAYVGVHLDTANAHDLGYTEQWIEILGPRITQIHMRDTLFKRGHCDEDTTATALYLGDNDWPAIRAAMTKIGYDGWLIAEPVPRYHYARDQQFYDNSVALDRFILGSF
jgi:L-ribulose-5-phosphate 3-epimerase